MSVPLSELGPPTPPLPQARVSPPEPKRGHPRLRARGWGSPNRQSDDWRNAFMDSVYSVAVNPKFGLTNEFFIGIG